MLDWTVPAVKQALQRSGWDIHSLSASRSMSLCGLAIVVARELGLSEDIVNVKRCCGPWPSDWRNRCNTDDQADPLDAQRLVCGAALSLFASGGGQGIALAIEMLH